MTSARRNCMVAAVLVSFLSVGARRNTPTKANALLLVANKADHTVSIVDPDAGRELAAVPVG